MLRVRALKPPYPPGSVTFVRGSGEEIVLSREDAKRIVAITRDGKRSQSVILMEDEDFKR